MQLFPVLFECTDLLVLPWAPSKIVIGDESCYIQHDAKTKRQNSEWHTINSLRPKIASDLFDHCVVIHKEFSLLDKS